jgi:ketosteroid isomerase-like protein
VNNWRQAALLLLLLLGSLIAFTMNSPANESNDEQKRAITAVMEAQVAAWNRGDLEGYMAGYWQSPELSFYSGKSVTRGWQPTLDRYRSRYQSAGSEMGKLTFSDLEIELLGPDSAYVRGKWGLQLSKENIGGLYTLVFKKLPSGWRIVHDHTSG